MENGTHKKEIKHFSWKINNKELHNVAERLSEFNDKDLQLLRKCLKLENMRRKGKHFNGD